MSSSFNVDVNMMPSKHSSFLLSSGNNNRKQQKTI